MKNALALVAVAFAVIAIGLSWKGSSREVAGGAPSEAVDLEPVITRLAALEKVTSDLQRELQTDGLETPTREAVPPALQSNSDADLARRLEQLEREVLELRIKRFDPAGSSEASSGRQRSVGRDGLSVDQATARARDLRASEAERMAALRVLRGQRLADGTDARLAVLDDMIQLATTSNDGATRADVWRQLSHVTDARLKGPLLDALALDKDEHSREEAAESLADFLPDTQVEAALWNAAQNDASKGVRKQAGSSLAGGH